MIVDNKLKPADGGFVFESGFCAFKANYPPDAMGALDGFCYRMPAGAIQFTFHELPEKVQEALRRAFANA
jgi:hypothetical protein